MSVAAARGRPRALRREIEAALRSRVPLRKLDEALLQLVPFAGYGRAINAFRELQDLAPHPAARPEGSRGRFRQRGEALCRRVYGPDVYTRLMTRMRSYHPDLADWILKDGYGKVLARPGLTPRERELLVVAVLAALRLREQLPWHVQGALRVGATRAEVAAVLRTQTRTSRRLPRRPPP